MGIDEIINYLKAKKNILLLSGSLCDEIELDGKKLLDYAAEIAEKLSIPIAATGNTVKGLKDKNVTTKKVWAAEIPLYMKYGWDDPFFTEKPELIVFIGYDSDIERALITALDVDTIVLDNKHIDQATLSLPDSTPEQWKSYLEEIINKL
jgi:CO dehydrogenase/acetyl-CoA synthase epsilon subunit